MNSCQSCGALDPEWQPLYHDLALFSCPECQSFSFFSEGPFDASAVYSRRYFEGGEYADYFGHRRAHEVNFRKKWAILARYLRGETRLLEVGCAYGLFIGFAQDQGVREVLGIDVSADAIDFATRTFGPHFAVSVDGTHPAFAYNCLVAWDVWEHLPRPLAYFTRLVADLDPGGLFAVATVDSSSCGSHDTAGAAGGRFTRRLTSIIRRSALWGARCGASVSRRCTTGTSASTGLSRHISRRWGSGASFGASRPSERCPSRSISATIS